MLGTGTPIIDLEREGPAVAIKHEKRTYLFDCGRGVVRRLVQAKLIPNLINHVFLTHLHSDHTIGLPDFIFTIGVEGRSQPVKIFGPKGTNQMVHYILTAFAEDIKIRVKGLESANPVAYQMETEEIKPGLVYKDANIKVFCFPVEHGEWESFGYRIELKDKIVVISGDTIPCASLVEHSKGCDILIHEVYSTSALEKKSTHWYNYHSSMHTSSVELGKIAAKINPSKLILYHQLYWTGSDKDILKDIRDSYARKIISANDLLEIKL
jgi:ribonuclease BN (tRNA processing enzyme)